MTKLRHIIVLLIILSFSFYLYGSDLVYCFYVPFTNKENNGYSIHNPDAFLSQQSIDRRQMFNIPIDYLDLPVTKSYTDSLKNMGFNLQYSLKWFNGAVVYTYDSSLVELLKNISFIKEPILIGNFDPQLKSSRNKFHKEEESNDIFNESFSQINLENGFFLHDKGYWGKGKTIAIIDAGFQNANFLPAFDSTWERNQVLGFKDFSTFPSDIFSTHSHGMRVFSIISGNIPNELIGSSPDAFVWLLRSEVVAYEQPIEEYNWNAAAEFADSVGVDIINTSLGYNLYDLPFKSYSYENMDGKTAIISQASTIAARKGILVITSAGNEGNDPWLYINAPADADSTIAVGATNAFGERAAFSSIGPTFDNRVKPDVMAMGSLVLNQEASGSVSTGNGTSFSAPVISGLAACLWQAFPEVNNYGIREAIIFSSNYYENPNPLYGYGIPDFEEAYNILDKVINQDLIKTRVLPNVFSHVITIEILSDITEKCIVRIVNTNGILIFEKQYRIETYLDKINIDFSFLNEGIYLLSLQFTDRLENHKIIKIQ